MAMNKKGVFFTLISILFLGIIYYSINIDHSYSLKEKSLITGERIKSVDFFIDDLEKDIERGTYIAMFRSLLGIQQYITTTGHFLNNTQYTFQEIIINGTIDGDYQSVMNDTELSIWIAKIRKESRKILIDFNYTINDVRVYHENPWVVTTDVNVTLNIFDMKDTASWTREKVITSRVNITSFEDPLYAVYTYGRVINTIQETNITDFVDAGGPYNLLEHIDNSYYRESTSGPSYIMRLSGNLSSSPFGIEGIVNLKKLDDASLTVYDKTTIDYLYFSNSSPVSWLINETYNWFRMDNESGHLDIYEVQNLTI